MIGPRLLGGQDREQDPGSLKTILAELDAKIHDLLIRAHEDPELFEALAEERMGPLARVEVGGLRFALVLLPRPPRRPLTARQREILDRIGHGQGNKGIARALGISPRTVEHHLGKIFEKLGVTSRAQLGRYAAFLSLNSGS